MTSFWVVREILHAQTLKIRAEVLSLYIRTAKLLSRKDKATFDRLDYLMSKEDNYKRLRDFISSQSMVSCIPYLGMYLSDLTYIDSAYPSTGSILENEQRIEPDEQHSQNHIGPAEILHLRYTSVASHTEVSQLSQVYRGAAEVCGGRQLQKIEPGTSTPRANASKEDLVGQEASASPLCGRKCTIAAEGTKVPATPPSPRNLLPYGHRKCHSLGYNFIHKMNTVEFKSATFPNAGSRHLLDDSVMESHSPTRGQAESSTLSSGISLGSSEGSELSEEVSWPAFESSAESEELAVHLYPGAVTVQGVLRRKTVLKEGKKPTVASWTKYWVALCGVQLYYYPAKSLKATERKHFKSTSSKSVDETLGRDRAAVGSGV
ncbi:Ras-specific guanine nucleotide-releasing factor RalGPS2 [Larimichthys crocea]|uniref:Uncharacterized protein n=1 Tax=Larimichthys crocea TaxID=215358 RepID=A0ACD3RNE6_LARCR|nr:Ras-specific guanine nucleotide-releasing factor RalGPS2 [Larimichthys crocea]